MRIAWKIAPSLVGEVPVRLLVWSRCTVHFQPVGFAVWTIAYSTPLCSIVDQTDGRLEGCLAVPDFERGTEAPGLFPPAKSVGVQRTAKHAGAKQRGVPNEHRR